MVKTFIMLFMLVPSLPVYAADHAFNATTDGRLFETLTAVDIETLSATDIAAYQLWQARSDTGTSTYQQSEGPGIMDISSDFSM